VPAGLPAPVAVARRGSVVSRLPSRPTAAVARPTPRHRARRTRPLLVVLALALLLVACGGDDPDTDGSAATEGGEAATSTQLAVAVASFDVHVGDDVRLLTGLYTPERQLVGFGTVTYQLGFLGDDEGGEAELTQEVTASYLPIPGMEPSGSSDVPILLTDASGNGVYAGRVELDRPGNWGLRVLAELEDGRVLEGQAVIPVAAGPAVPAVGDPAPRSVNLTIDDVAAGRARPVALDSRAQDDDTPVEDIPDQHLHQRTVADSLDAGRPVLVNVATPVYCVSRFCGPLTDVISDLALEYEDVVDTVHLEVWEDFDEQTLNPAAAEWIQTELGGNEPWVFLVDADGTIMARWDNVLDVAELRALLDQLPALPDEPAADA
jgi:hypothetical protein